jgi:hypothetical protein
MNVELDSGDIYFPAGTGNWDEPCIWEIQHIFRVSTVH